MPGNKKIRIALEAETRCEFEEEVFVPEDYTNEQLDDLVQQRWQDGDGGHFTDDESYWEQGHCYWEPIGWTPEPRPEEPPENEKQYIERRGFDCPNCGKRNMECTGDVKVECGMAFVGKYCPDCDATWQDQFKLFRLRDLEVPVKR
jgi:hypothetical protein